MQPYPDRPPHPAVRRGSRSQLHVVQIAVFAILSFCGVEIVLAGSLPTSDFHLSEAASQILNQLYGGQSEAALADARRMQSGLPAEPLGYLLEGEIRWWRVYCTSLEFRYNFLQLKRLPHADKDDPDLALASKEISLAESRIAGHETAEMHLYAGMGYALRARLMDLHGDRGGTARAGVRAREHFLRAKELDSKIADADFGLGLYNYYVDTLSGIARALRFFMGIPGGNKKEGITQLEHAIALGELTPIEARFYLSVNLRTYDREYERAAVLIEPLVREYPENPVFALMLANMYSLLNRKEKAEALFHAAESMPISDAECAAHVKEIAAAGLARLASVNSASN